MASFDVHVDGLNNITTPGNVGKVPADPFVLKANDVLNFIYDGAGNTLTVSSFSSDQFTDSTNLVLGRGGSGSKTVLASPTYNSDTINLDLAAYATTFLYIQTLPPPTNYTAQIDYFQETGTASLFCPNGGGTPTNRLEVRREDTITIVNAANFYTASVSGMDVNKFTPSTTQTVQPGGGTAIFTVKVDAPYEDDILIVVIQGIQKNLYVSIVSGVDTTPNPFDIGFPVITANLSEYYIFEQFKVSGINSPADVTATNCDYRVNGGSFVVSGQVLNNDFVEVRKLSASSYDTLLGCSLDIGGVTDSNTVRTKLNPQDGAIVSFPYTHPFTLTNVTEFFGAPLSNPFANAPRFMSAYRKGGDHVPDITQNSSIASTNQAEDLVLGSFIGSATSIYYDQYPPNKSAFANTIDGAKTLSLSWQATVDWTMGYGELTPYNMEYQYILTENPADISQNQLTGVTFTGINGSPGTYSNTNTLFTISASSGQSTEAQYTGIVTILAKSIINPNIILTKDVYYALFFYGP